MCLTLPLMAACNSPAARPVDDVRSATAGGITVLEVRPAVYIPDSTHAPDAALAGRCAAWSLSAEDVARFFSASREYPDGTHDAFYALPCTISGTLQAEGKTWSYEINAGATAIWTRDSVTRRFGCTDAVCAPLVLMMPDDNSGR